MSNAPEILVGLSQEELEALADSDLAPSAQSRLDNLLERNAECQLGPNEQIELDRQLARVDNSQFSNAGQVYAASDSRSN